MRTLTKMSLRLLLLCVAGAASVWVATLAVDEIELRGATSVREALAHEGLDWAMVETDGLLAKLSGEAPDEATRFRALTVAGDAVNAANLRDMMTVAAPSETVAPAFRLEILRRGSDITVHGLIPGAARGLDTLKRRIEAIRQDIVISDLVTANPTPPTEQWETSVDLGLRAISALENSRVLITAEAVDVSGLALDAEQADRFETTLRAEADEHTAISVALRVPRPAISPFIARFRLDEAGGMVDACSADSEDGRDRIVSAARDIGITGPIDCLVALGAPDTEWESIVELGLTTLSELGTATLTLSDLDMTIVPGDEVPPETVAQAVAKLEEDLPAIYTLNVPSSASQNGSDEEKRLTFTATLSADGIAELQGPLPDRRNTEIVESVAAARFRKDNLQLSLRQEAGLPEDWPVRVIAALDAFATIDTGVLTVSPSLIEIVGRTGSMGSSEDITSKLTTALGPDIQFSIDVAYDEALDPAAALPTPEECIADVKAIQERTKITFGPGETALDVDAIKIVRRIADVLKGCTAANVEIAGYTDSQGRDEMNQALSQSRADSVFNALLGERVLTTGLTAKGYGEADPVESNDTSDGREANRRIEFRLITQDAGDQEDRATETDETEPESPDGQN